MMDRHLPCSHVHVHVPCPPCCACPAGLCCTGTGLLWYPGTVCLVYTVQDRTSGRTREAGMGKLLQQAVQQLPSPSQIAAFVLSLYVMYVPRYLVRYVRQYVGYMLEILASKRAQYSVSRCHQW